MGGTTAVIAAMAVMARLRGQSLARPFAKGLRESRERELGIGRSHNTSEYLRIAKQKLPKQFGKNP
jgi:hypothetical protein